MWSGLDVSWCDGLFFRSNLFHDVPPEIVHVALEEFYSTRGYRLMRTAGDPAERLELHENDNRWVCLRLGIGWEWELRRDAYLHVSRELHCAGFFLFVHDGDFWGYEFFDNGVVLDHFMQDPDTLSGFPGPPTRGDPGLRAVSPSP